MNNIKILRERPDIKNGWVVRADTKRFGVNEIMFEGSYDDCIRYWKRLFRNPKTEKIVAYIKGYFPEYCLEIDDTITLHRNGFEEHASGIY